MNARTAWILAGWLWASSVPAAAAGPEGTTLAADALTARGRNLASVTADRGSLGDLPDFDFLVETLARQTPLRLAPVVERPVYPVLDPEPLESYKVYKPWRRGFRRGLVFALGRINAERYGIVKWQVVLHDAGGREIKRFGGAGAPPAAFSWDGRNRELQTVPVGKQVFPELVLEDMYGARVRLPQRKLVVDRFLWEERRRLKAGALQSHCFGPGRRRLSADGEALLRELALDVDRFGARLLTVVCRGPDPKRQQQRAEALKAFFERENLRVETIRAETRTAGGDPVFEVTAWRDSRSAP